MLADYAGRSQSGAWHAPLGVLRKPQCAVADGLVVLITASPSSRAEASDDDREVETKAPSTFATPSDGVEQEQRQVECEAEYQEKAAECEAIRN